MADENSTDPKTPQRQQKTDRLQTAGVLVAIVSSVLSLAISGFSVWLQFKPKEEKIVIGSIQSLATNDPAQFTRTFPLPWGNSTLAGPVYWKFSVSNNSDKTVSIIDAEYFYNVDNKQEFIASGMNSIVVDGDGKPAFPINIPSGETKTAILRTNFPVWIPDLAIQAACPYTGKTVRQIERCFLERGRDILGNEVSPTIIDGNFQGASWTAGQRSVSIKVKFRSSTEKVYVQPFEYYPFESLQANK